MQRTEDEQKKSRNGRKSIFKAECMECTMSASQLRVQRIKMEIIAHFPLANKFLLSNIEINSNIWGKRNKMEHMRDRMHRKLKSKSNCVCDASEISSEKPHSCCCYCTIEQLKLWRLDTFHKLIASTAHFDQISAWELRVATLAILSANNGKIQINYMPFRWDRLCYWKISPGNDRIQKCVPRHPRSFSGSK